MAESKITPRNQDFAAWYQDVVLEGDMAEPAEIVKGCMVIKANGYAVWEALQREFDARFKESGHQNVYFPLLIPQSFLRKEAEHVQGFSPELAMVTIAGGKELEEPYVIRPTSETIVGHFFSKWIQSWRDLPVLMNQWANVVRWELRTRMFLRTSEFLWQEGHTAHASHEEALDEVFRILDIYADVAEEVMAMPAIKGLKTSGEKFAGALQSYSIEAMMQNGLALQAGTSHDLGQNFGRAFDVKFQTKQNTLDYVWQTSWGISTRLIGGLIMTHSDDRGLVLPPKLAPFRGVLVPIYRKGEERTAVLETAQKIASDLKIKLDDREGLTTGTKFFHWERLGVPLVIELGPRDLASGSVVLKRRDTGVKQSVPQADLSTHVQTMLDRMQFDLYAAAKARLKENTVLANSIEEVEEILRDVTAEKGGGKFVMTHLKDDPRAEARLKEFKATVRNVPLVDEYDGPGKCVVTGERVEQRVVVAKAY
ncbi:MAG TPA: proline--tRNA ligase [Bryobacteraceae bacterium]|jgi:prolyl-tRNA synthetase|nr:proline--tRNA ligase [Bryobacteraceae bacterium]